MSNDFSKAIENAEEEGPKFEGPLSGFGQVLPYTKKTPQDPTNPTDKTIKAYKYTFDHRVFILFRPWNECPVCMKAFKEDRLEFPAVGDYTCPHHNKAEFLELNRKFLQDGWIQHSYKEEILKSGVLLVSMGWLIPHEKQEVRRGPPRV
jgi:hypothetical protein